MGLFDKIKKMFTKEEKEPRVEEELLEEELDEEQEEIEIKKEETKQVKEEVKIYEKGLTKSRENFVSKLINLTNKYQP